MIKERMLATLPGIFKGDERQVLVDWINNMSLSSQDLSDLKAKGGTHHAGAIIMECGHGAVSFEAARRCEAAGLDPIDYERAMIRTAFGSVWAVLKYQTPEVRDAVALDLAAFAIDEAMELISR